MKNILIIQTDGPYFLEETLRTLEHFSDLIINDKTTILVNQNSYESIPSDSRPLIPGVSWNTEEILKNKYDISINMSLDSTSWVIHEKINADYKRGPRIASDKLFCEDLWGLFFLTFKANPPFLTFHLRDIYRNILGFKSNIKNEPQRIKTLKNIIWGKFNTQNISNEFELKIRNQVAQDLPGLRFKEIHEIDLIDNLSDCIYIGPPCSEALRLNEAGATSLLITQRFEGFNLLPYEDGNYLLQTSLDISNTHKVSNSILKILTKSSEPLSLDQNLFAITTKYGFGSYLELVEGKSIVHTFYQAHCILWNFLLNYFELKLTPNELDVKNLNFLTEYDQLATQILKLIDFGINFSEKILSESKNEYPSLKVIQENIKLLDDLENTLFQISNKSLYINQIIDFYKLRRSQNNEEKLIDQAQINLLNFFEQRHALEAFHELITYNTKKLSLDL